MRNSSTGALIRFIQDIIFSEIVPQEIKSKALEVYTKVMVTENSPCQKLGPFEILLSDYNKIKDLLLASKKIEAIKYLRDIVSQEKEDCGLVEAKNAVESLIKPSAQ
jgi:hypothetical protein